MFNVDNKAGAVYTYYDVIVIVYNVYYIHTLTEHIRHENRSISTHITRTERTNNNYSSHLSIYTHTEKK